MAQQMKEAILDGVSIICVDPANDNKIVGFRTAFTVNRCPMPDHLQVVEGSKIVEMTKVFLSDIFHLDYQMNKNMKRVPP